MSKKKTHSQGPWSWKITSGGQGRIYAKDGYDVVSVLIGSKIEGCRPGEDKANMCLIAAAPELLEALKAITEELEVQYDQANEHGGDFELERIKLCQQARAAIAQAEGRS